MADLAWNQKTLSYIKTTFLIKNETCWVDIKRSQNKLQQMSMNFVDKWLLESVTFDVFYWVGIWTSKAKQI